MRHLPTQKVTFIHNPKTAGTSIVSWLDENFYTIQGRKHGHIIEVNEFFPRTEITFGVVRNPWARLASWYIFADGGRTPFRHWALSRFSQIEPSGLNLYPDRQKAFWARNWYKLDTPQANWFGSNTIILKFENLEEDFKKIQTLLGCDKPLPVRNVSPKYDYRELYTQDIIDLVWDIYFKDVVEYGYSF